MNVSALHALTARRLTSLVKSSLTVLPCLKTYNTSPFKVLSLSCDNNQPLSGSTAPQHAKTGSVPEVVVYNNPQDSQLRYPTRCCLQEALVVCYFDNLEVLSPWYLVHSGAGQAEINPTGLRFLSAEHHIRMKGTIRVFFPLLPFYSCIQRAFKCFEIPFCAQISLSLSKSTSPIHVTSRNSTARYLLTLLGYSMPIHVCPGTGSPYLPTHSASISTCAESPLYSPAASCLTPNPKSKILLAH
ncbi:hypothetical protein C8R48DRAFT_83283 [Suillus tomentosus]|nr:hypothetical protein C8R48DRAFT_83283 [Suillus tomentosus]